MFLFPFLEKSKKLLKWTGEHLTTPVNLDEHGATRNMKNAWRIATFLYIGELRWQMFNGSPKRKAARSNRARDATKKAESPPGFRLSFTFSVRSPLQISYFPDILADTTWRNCLFYPFRKWYQLRLHIVRRISDVSHVAHFCILKLRYCLIILVKGSCVYVVVRSQFEAAPCS